MKTIEHSAGGRRYHFAGANADLWQIATEQSGLFTGRDFDILARAFGASDDNERMEASKALITKFWKTYPELGPYPFLECLSKFEFERQFHNKYRDHVCHQLKVYLLGLGVLSCSRSLRDETESLIGKDNLDLVWLVTSVYHDIGYVVENEHAQPGEGVWQRVQDAYDTAMRSPLKSLCQKTGLSEAAEQRIQSSYSIKTPTLDGIGDLEKDFLFQAFKEEGVRAKLASLSDVTRTPVQRYFDYAQKNKTTSSRPPFKDHGVASALLLAKTWMDLDKYLVRLAEEPLPHRSRGADEAIEALNKIRAPVETLIAKRRDLKSQIMRAAGAMSLHNIAPGQWNHADAATQGLTFDTFRIAIGKHNSETSNPLAFLLAFVDTLQDWDRPTFSETPNEGALHSHDISVAPDKKAGKILVYVKKDAEEFRHPSTSKHSKYSRIVRCLKEFLDEDDVDSLITWTIPVSEWEVDFNAAIKVPASYPWRWTVVLSKDEASRHGELMSSLKGHAKPRFIDSGFAYWGIGPTIQWRAACEDHFYDVMRRGIETFQARWERLRRKFDARLPCVYVSYGVGTGEKDRDVLKTLNADQGAPIYVPIDMSLDMLVKGAKKASKEVIERSRIIPLQLDFSSIVELVTVSEIRRNVLPDRPVLFSLLGNTLANFEDDVTTLKTLAQLMRADDLMLVELAATNIVDATTAKIASAEYSNSRHFDNFVRSALTQHTDLPLNMIEYRGEACHNEEALQIDMNYVSADGCEGRFIDGTLIKLMRDEKIRLYRSRKYTHMAIKRILQQVDLAEVVDDLQWNDANSPFGLYLGLFRSVQ